MDLFGARAYNVFLEVGAEVFGTPGDAIFWSGAAFMGDEDDPDYVTILLKGNFWISLTKNSVAVNKNTRMFADVDETLNYFAFMLRQCLPNHRFDPESLSLVDEAYQLQFDEIDEVNPRLVDLTRSVILERTLDKIQHKH